MSGDFRPPSEGFLSELNAVAAAAGALQRFFIETRPNLPSQFDKVALDEICLALLILPHGSADGAIENLILANDRLPSFRPKLAKPSDDEEDGPAFDRGGALDGQITNVILAVISAIDFYANEHPDWERPPLDRTDPPVSVDDESRGDLDTLAEETNQTRREIGQARGKLPNEEESASPASAIKRGAADTESTLHLTKAELSQREPKPNRLEKLGTHLLNGIEKISGFVADHGEELAEPWIDQGKEAFVDTWKGLVKRVKGIANAVRSNAQTIRRIRDEQKPAPPASKD